MSAIRQDMGAGHPEVDLVDERIVTDLVGRPLGDDEAVGHHDDTLGDAQGDVHVVLDEQQRRVGAEVTQQFAQSLPLTTGESRCRLVEHHQLRLGDDDHADLELALLTVGEVADDGCRGDR